MSNTLGSQLYSNTNGIEFSVRMEKKYFCQLILLFNLFFILFMGPTALFDIIYKSHHTILTNFYLYLQYFQQKIFSFSKISGFQTDT